jgi:predicted RNA binding protein YcfA (HicA-like mRNA interferase family)
MVGLPVISGKKLIKALEDDGFVIVRQKGSHVGLQKEQCVITKERLVELLK